MKYKNTKFLLTQISAPIVGIASVFLIIFLTKGISPNLFSELNFFKVSVVIIIFGIVLIGSMAIWGKILVLFKILSKEEAKGYPYSKPWNEHQEL